MIKSILCLTDFSPVAHNGLEYAANLARLLAAKITLMHVRPTIWPEAAQLAREREQSNAEITDLLKRSSELVKENYQVPCTVQLVSTLETLEQAVASVSQNFDLVVMGTSGADDYYQFIFGSNSYRVLEGVRCPVLVVPLSYHFKKPIQVVYAYDPHTNPIFWVDTLIDFANSLEVSVSVYYVMKGERSAETERLLDVVKHAILARSHKKVKWQFDADFSNDVAWSIEKYVSKKQPDIVALSYHHRSIAESVFEKDTIKQAIMTFSCPVLVFWH
jgi:nucleotide-binding universal stress UspA family protein